MSKYEISDYFEFLDAAQMQVLPPRMSKMFSLRYGFTDGRIHKLSEIANEFELSRERIRQLLVKSHRNISSAVTRIQKNPENPTHPCFELVRYLHLLVKPFEPNSPERFTCFVDDLLPSLPCYSKNLEFLARLTFSDLSARQEAINQATTFFKQKGGEQDFPSKTPTKQDRMHKLLSSAIWIGTKKIIGDRDLSILTKKRFVSSTGDGKNGQFYSSKTNSVVEYESGLELRFLQQLDSTASVVYYLEQPFVIPYFYDGKNHDYYPDIFLILNDGSGVVVEIKPLKQMCLEQNLVKWRAMRGFCEQNGFGFLITDGVHSVREILSYNSTQIQFVNRIMNSLSKGPVYWRQYQEIISDYEISTMEFVSMVLKNRVRWQLSPFQLRLNESFDYISIFY